MNIVVQGFGPFGKFAANPSGMLVADLARRLGTTRSGVDHVVTEVLTTSIAEVGRRVPELVAEHRPDVWLGLGLAAGRPSLSIEAAALNLASWDDPDEGDAVVRRGPVLPGGPAAHLTGLPVEAVLDAWAAAGVPGYLSQTAGSYLCNLSFYLAAQTAMDLGLACRVGFVHLPLFPEQVTEPARQPSMGRALQAAGLDAVIDACLDSTGDDGLHLRASPAWEPDPTYHLALLYHLALRDEWDDAVGGGGPYERSTLGRSLADVGFVHCSLPHQVQTTADAVYRARHDVVLLTIDPEKVGAEVRMEGDDERFPHLYGALALDAVVEVRPLAPGVDGRLVVGMLPAGGA